jgi:hypothetical protein
MPNLVDNTAIVLARPAFTVCAVRLDSEVSARARTLVTELVEYINSIVFCT